MLSRRERKSLRRPTRGANRLGLEALEGRCLLSTFTWFQAVDGNFNDSAKWRDQNNNPGVPGAGDDATTPGGINITINSAASVHTLSTSAHLLITSGSLTLADNSNLGGEVDLSGGTTLNLGANGDYTLGFNASKSQLAGTINLGSYATLGLASFVLTGTINGAAGSTTTFYGSSMSINAGASTTGAGQYVLGGSTSYGPVLTLNTNWTAPSLFAVNTNGGLNGTGALNVPGMLNLQSGDLSGTGAINLQTGSTTNIRAAITLDTRTLNNAGTLNLFAAGQISALNAALFNNQVGGTFSVQNEGTIMTGAGSFTNAGTFTKTSASGAETSNCYVPFNNSGTVQVQSGTLELDGGGTSTKTFNVASDATLAFDNATSYNLNSGTAFTGNGLLVYIGEYSLNVNAAVSLPSLEIDGGTLNVSSTGSLTATGPVSVAIGAILNLTGGMTLSSGASLNLAGILGGSGNLTVASGAAFNWTGGQMNGPGATTIQAGASFTLSGSGQMNSFRSLSNAGTATYSGTGDLDLDSGSLWTNSGSFTLSSDTTFLGGGRGRITNTGTWTKSSATNDGTTLLDAVFSNASGGTVNVTKGILQLNAGGSDAGAFNVPSGQTLDFTGGYNTLSSGTTLGGTGVYLIDGATVAMPAALSVANLTLNTGTLTGSAALTVTGALAWTGSGTMSGSGSTTIVSGATLTLSGPGDRTLDTRTLTNAGTGTWSSTANWTLADSALFNNSGIFTVQNDQTIMNSNNPGTVANTGTWNKTSPAGAGTTTIDSLFNNTGAGKVNVNSGVLMLVGGGTDAAAFSVAAGQVLDFSGTATYLLSSGASLGGSGTYEQDNGTVTDNATLTVPVLTLTGGIWTGGGSLTVSHLLTWTGSSTMAGTGSTTIPSGATLTLGGGAGNQTLDTRTLTNAGSATWTGTGIFSVSDSAIFTNSGSFAVQNDSTLGSFGNAGMISNTGTWTKTSPVGTGTTTVNALFNNSGTTSVTTGVLLLDGGGTSSGTFSIAAGQTLGISNNYTLNAGNTFTGAGLVDLQVGTLTANVATTATNFEIDNGGTFAGAGNFTVTGTLNWNGGTITGPTSSVLTLPTGSTLNLQSNANKTLDTRTLTVLGTANWRDGGNIVLSNSAVFTINAGATFNLFNNQTLSGSGTVNNAGTLVKQAGTSTSTISPTLFNNTGMVEVTSGNTLIFTSAVAQVSGNSLTGGIWDAQGGTLNLNVSGGLTTLGSGARVLLNGAGSTFKDLAALANLAGQLQLLNGASFSSTGNLSNSGTLLLSGATLLTVNGAFSQTAAGTLTAVLSGTVANPILGQIKTTGAVSLAGKLSFSSTISPTVGSSFTLLSNQQNAAISGNFSGLLDGATFAVGSMTFRINYVEAGGAQHNVVLTRTA